MDNTSGSPDQHNWFAGDGSTPPDSARLLMTGSTTSRVSDLLNFVDVQPERYRNPQVEKVEKLRTEFRQQHLDAAKKYRRPLNILILGLSGVGKSSFINSLLSAILDKRSEYVTTGSSGGCDRPNITVYLRQINCFDPTSDDPERIPCEETEEEELLKDIATWFIDIAGLPNEDNATMRTVLRLLLHGHIPIAEPVTDVYGSVGEDDRNGPVTLRARFPTANPDLLIDRVVLVAAANMDPPMELVKALMHAAQMPNPDKTDSRKTTLQYLVITKTDLLSKMGEEEHNKFDINRMNLKHQMSLEGTGRYLQCENYWWSDHSSDRSADPKKDTKFLEFLINLCSRDTYNIHGKDKLRPLTDAEIQSTYSSSASQEAMDTETRREFEHYHQQDSYHAVLLSLAIVVLALSVYVGVLLHYQVIQDLVAMRPYGPVAAGVLILTPLWVLLYFVVCPLRRFK